MITMAQRIEELRTEKGLSRPLCLPHWLSQDGGGEIRDRPGHPHGRAAEENGRLFRRLPVLSEGGEQRKTRQETWDGRGLCGRRRARPPRPQAGRAAAPQPKSGGGDQGTVFGSLLRTPAFQEMVRETVLEVLRSPEGQELLSRTVRRELDRR